MQGSATLDDITSASWSLALDQSMPQAGYGAGVGNVVQGIAGINQSIGLSLTTPKASAPFRPTFATDIWQFIDMPVDLARPQLVREIVESLTRWEPRIKVLQVLVDLVGL